MQMTGVVEMDGKKLAAPTISGQFDQKLVATLEDGSQRVLWEKQYPPGGLGRYSLTKSTAMVLKVK